MRSSGSLQTRAHRSVYQEGEVVEEYRQLGSQLQQGERVILDRLTDLIRNSAVLDVGVGTGRTTSSLLVLTSDYLGIDFSEVMIARCSADYPAAKFRVFDARDLCSLDDKLYRFIWFSFNGIDSLNHDDRIAFQMNVLNKLEPGGLFFFSSHNRRACSEKPWNLDFWVYNWNFPRQAFWRSAGMLLRCVWNYALRRHRQVEADDHALRLDSGSDYRLLHYYADPEEQVRSLEVMGFVKVEVFTLSGDPLPENDRMIHKRPHLLYLAQKAEFSEHV